MKALQKVARGKGHIEVRDVPKPTIPAPNWVLIKVKAAGVCGTDLHIWHDEFTYWPPVTLGHEFRALSKRWAAKSLGLRSETGLWPSRIQGVRGVRKLSPGQRADM